MLLSELDPILNTICSTLSLDEQGSFVSNNPAHGEIIDAFNYQLSISPEESAAAFQLVLYRDLIYAIFYLNRTDTGENYQKDAENRLETGAKSELFDQLHMHNTGLGYGDPGWRFLQVDERDQWGVNKNGLTLWIKPKKHLVLENGQEYRDQWEVVPDPNNLTIRLPKNQVEPGFYVAIANAGPIQRQFGNDYLSITTLHFNFAMADAPRAIAFWTKALNAEDIQFSFKVGYDHGVYSRSDPGLLWIYTQDKSIWEAHLGHFLVEAESWLKPEVPMLTQKLGPGVGFSELPQYPFFALEDFHLNRCHLIAQGLLNAWSAGKSSLSDCLASIEASFAEYGCNLSTPHLNSDSGRPSN
jgi:hypothetical protein